MKRYLTNLIEENGRSVDELININGHFGVTYRMLIDYIATNQKIYHQTIRMTLVKIDFLNGDFYHYLNHLAEGMAAQEFGAFIPPDKKRLKIVDNNLKNQKTFLNKLKKIYRKSSCLDAVISDINLKNK